MDSYEGDIAEVEQTEGFGGDRLGLNEILQDVHGGCLDVAVILRKRGRNKRRTTPLMCPISELEISHSRSPFTPSGTALSFCQIQCVRSVCTHHHLVQELVDQSEVQADGFLTHAAAVILNQSDEPARDTPQQQS